MKYKKNMRLFLLKFPLFPLFLIISCDLMYQENLYIPIYQDAIYIANADGNNSTKVIDINACRNVQLIPNSNKILYIRTDIHGSYNEYLYIINEDGSENTKICDELNLSSSKPKISDDGQFCYTISFNYGNPTSNIYEFDLIHNSYRNVTNNDNRHVYAFDYKYNTLVYTLEQSQDELALMKLDLNTNQLDTLLIVQSNTFISSVIFGNSTDEIFFSWAGEDFVNGIYKMSISENIVEAVTTEIFGGGLTFPFNNDLFIEHSEILHLDLLNGTITSLVNGRYPDFINGKMVYATDYMDYNSEIRELNLSDMKNKLLVSNGFCPMYSQNGEKIIFIGSYLTNQRVKSSITN